METINIKYFVEGLTPIEQKEGGDWIDLRAAEDIQLEAGEFKLIPLGIGMKLPEGFGAYVVPRSSTYKNFKIISANHVGIIDNAYCGNEDQWYFPAIALQDTIIHKNDRICQFRIVEIQPKVQFNVVSELEDKSRGGFGSTGVQ